MVPCESNAKRLLVVLHPQRGPDRSGQLGLRSLESHGGRDHSNVGARAVEETAGGRGGAAHVRDGSVSVTVNYGVNTV